ncbi:MAG: FCD domain-containing protein [Rhodoferax sp.]|uniref:FCD domain-containing protein n=1 Tax=Rhodoferax sp. TaxID=50421 RepID=UPI003018C6C7
MQRALSVPLDNVLSLVQSTSLTRLVADSVESLILSGELAPGAKLNEVALAERFRVSRGPLREAFRLLEESGLIYQEKNRGAFVRVVELREAAELYEVRAGLDATAGRLLAERINAEQLSDLRKLTDQMKTVDKTDVDQFHILNLDFHDKIIAMTGNLTLTVTYRKLAKQLALFRKRNLMTPMAIPHFAQEHSAIVDMLEQRDGLGCGEALYAHAQGGRQRMLRDGELAGVSHGC